MALFLTDYSEGDGTYGAYIEADTLAHARQIAGQRGLNERIMGRVGAAAMPNRLRALIEDGEWLEAAHEACFLGFVGLSSGALTPRDLLGDQGLVHELLHLARPLSHHPNEDPGVVAEDVAERDLLIQRVARMAVALEWRVPGWAPSGGQPGVRRFRGGEDGDIERGDESGIRRRTESRPKTRAAEDCTWAKTKRGRQLQRPARCRRCISKGTLLAGSRPGNGLPMGTPPITCPKPQPLV